MRRWSTLLTLAMTITLLPPAPPAPAAAASSPGWLEATNTVRSLGHVGDVRVDRGWSRGARQHARYMARHGELTHTQRRSRAGSTAAGAAAARTSNIGYGYPTSRRAVLGWLGSPRHAFWLLNPAATHFGLGHARSDDGRRWWTLRVFDQGSVDLGVPQRGGRLWPAEGAAVPDVRTRTHGLAGCGGDGTGGVAAYWRSRRAPRDAAMWVDGERVRSCLTEVQDGWWAVIARDAVHAGSRVQVQLAGRGMPGRRRFVVVDSLREAGTRR